ncbi:MAG: hypothetical protein GX079_04730 [Tissierellia bacterium]|nr:hypothetical protein [Tissierellia bacterium]
MIINYIYHSCYEILTDKYQIIIDYFRGPINLRKDREIIFLVSHGHEDHYTKEIHSMADWVFLWEGIDYRDEKTIPLAPGDEYLYKDISIRTSGSTDQGLSFEIGVEGKRLIHVGDLNNWIWPEDSQEERRAMEEDFLSYLSVFKKEPDILFFPVDYRLGENYDSGVDQALEILRPSLLFPLHFTEHPEILPIYKEKIKDKVRMILPDERPYQVI